MTVEPKPEDAPVNMDIHPGQEFNMVWEGRMDLRIGDKKFILEPGDLLFILMLISLTVCVLWIT